MSYRRAVLAALLGLAVGVPALGAEFLAPLKAPQDPAEFIKRENELRNEINQNFLLNSSASGIGNLVSAPPDLWFPSALSNLGIRTSVAPTAPIQICDESGSSGTQLPIVVVSCETTTNANAHGYRDSQTYIGTGSSSSFNSYDAWPTVTTAGTDPTTHYAGFQSRATISGDIPIFKGFQAIPTQTSGTITNYYSYFSQPGIITGNATNAYGFYAAQMSSIAHPSWATNRYAFYAVSDPSFFGGDVDVGTASYAGGVTPVLSVKNTAHQRLFNVGTAIGGGGVYVAGLAATGASAGRPTVDDAQILLDRSTDVSGGGIEWINSGSSNGYGHKIVNPGIASGDAGRSLDLIFYGRQNSATWTENMRIAPNGAGVGIVNSVMGANLNVGTSVGTMRVYNVVTDASNTEYGQFSWAGGVLGIGTNKLGSGSARAMTLMTGGTTAVTISTAQNVTLAAGLTATLPASAGAGGLNVCVDTAGVFYKKAACP